MTGWLQVWTWAEEEERSRRLREAIEHFGLDAAEVLGNRDAEDQLLERFAAASAQD